MTHLDNCSWLIVPYVYSRSVGKYEYSWICLRIKISIDACDGSTVAVVSTHRRQATTHRVPAHPQHVMDAGCMGMILVKADVAEHGHKQVLPWTHNGWLPSHFM